LSFNKKLHPTPMKTNQQVFTTKRGANGISWAGPTLGNCLLGVYSKIFLESFEQKSLRKSWKILKIFITLLCYGLHQKFAKIMLLSKKFKSIYKTFFNYTKTLVTMFLKCFWAINYNWKLWFIRFHKNTFEQLFRLNEHKCVEKKHFVEKVLSFER
jgi:hypothetical protein